MAQVQHSLLTGDELHDVKGVQSASDGQVLSAESGMSVFRDLFNEEEAHLVDAEEVPHAVDYALTASLGLDAAPVLSSPTITLGVDVATDNITYTVVPPVVDNRVEDINSTIANINNRLGALVTDVNALAGVLRAGINALKSHYNASITSVGNTGNENNGSIASWLGHIRTRFLSNQDAANHNAKQLAEVHNELITILNGLGITKTE